MRGLSKALKNVGCNLRAFMLALLGMVCFGMASVACLQGLQPMAVLSQWGSPTTTVVILGAQVLLFLCVMGVGACALYAVSGWLLLRALSWVWLLVSMELLKGLAGFQTVPLAMLELCVVGCIATAVFVVAPRVVHRLGETWTIRILPVIRLTRALSRKARRGDLPSPSRMSLNGPTLKLATLK